MPWFFSCATLIANFKQTFIVLLYQSWSQARKKVRSYLWQCQSYFNYYIKRSKFSVLCVVSWLFYFFFFLCSTLSSINCFYYTFSVSAVLTVHSLSHSLSHTHIFLLPQFPPILRLVLVLLKYRKSECERERAYESTCIMFMNCIIF